MWSRRANRAILATCLVGLAVVSLCTTVWFLAVHNGTLRAERDLTDRLTTTQRAVESEIERFRYLPSVVGEDGRVRDHLLGIGTSNQANSYLQTVRDMSGADEVYLLDTGGLTLAASNWDEPGSFVGNNYSFRPYFSDAMRDGAGRYYAVGVTTGKPGYFLAARVSGPDGPLGVVVAKVDMAPIEVTWSKAGELTGIADQIGIVFLSGRQDWKYRPLDALTPAALATLDAERRYDGIGVPAKQPIVGRPLLSGASLVLDDPSGALLASTVQIEPDGWTLFSALPLAPVYEEARLVTGIAGLAGLLASAIVLVLRQRRQFTRMKLEQNAVLESRVGERTEALHHEIEERKRTEAQLRDMQENLIHAAKLAALGRMSAAIVHEVSQPLSALENTLAASGLHADNKALPEVKRNLVSARDLVRRMQRTVKHLRTFASRKDAGALEPVDLAGVLDAACEIVSPRAREIGVLLERDSVEAPAVLGNGPRLEQAFINLILNAVDAAGTGEQRQVGIGAGIDGDNAVVAISDTGPGMPKEVRDRLFEPFFTTKTSGGGLGLGLSITRTILEEFGGSVCFASAPGGGTVTRVMLPLHLASRQAVAS